MDRYLTDARKDLIVGALLLGFLRAVAFLAALWLIAALIVGTVALGRWFGGIA